MGLFMWWGKRAEVSKDDDEDISIHLRQGAIDGDALARAEGYRSAAHKQGSLAGQRERQQRTSAGRIARAQSLGLVARAEYLTTDEEAAALKAGAAGLPDARLQQVRDRLLVVTPAGWINPKSRTAHRYGLHSFQLKGTSHRAAAQKAGRFSPHAVVRLVRESDNTHDSHAIAVFAKTGRQAAGYVPATIAKRLAPLINSGQNDLVAISTRGAGAGSEGTVPQILVCSRRSYDHLTSP